MMQLSVFLEHILQACEQSGKSTKEVLRIINKAGIKGLETNAGFIAGQKALQQEIKDFGLIFNCLYEFYDWEDFSDFSDTKKLDNHIQTAQKLGAKKILFVPPYFRKKDSIEAQLDSVVKMLTLACEKTKAHNITVMVEDFDNTLSPCSKITYLKTLFNKVPELKFNFDTGNFITNGEYALTGLEEFFPLIENVHCKDRKSTFECCATGNGELKIAELINQLKSKGYFMHSERNLTIEHFDVANQLEAMCQSADFLKQIFSEK